MKNNIFKKEFDLMTVLLRSIPAYVVVIFILAIIVMNLLAQITIISLPYLALNAAIFVSWITFLVMDVITKHYGAGAANRLSVLSIVVHLFFSLVFLLISKVSTIAWLNMFLGGQWSILIASTIAFVVSAIINNYINVGIGKFFVSNPNGMAAYVTRTYVSTFISQFIDNFLFVSLAFMVFPAIPGAFQVRWTVLQCLGCSATCAVIELISEIIFSPIGYKVSEKWRKNKVGEEYLCKYCLQGA